jgi:hypothetical protein
LATTLLTAVSTQAFAQDLTIWWNKSYYPEEDEQFDKTVAAFEAESGLDVEYVYYTNDRGRLGRGRADPGEPAADGNAGGDPAQRTDQ